MFFGPYHSDMATHGGSAVHRMLTLATRPAWPLGTMMLGNAAVAEIDEAKRHVATDPVIVQGERVAGNHADDAPTALMRLNELHRKLMPRRP
jgi:hypothetical protein